MKKLAALLCAVMMLCGCSARESADVASALPRVGVCWYDREEAGSVMLRAMLEVSLRQAGFEVTVKDGEGDQTRQDEQVSELVGAGVDLVILEPVMPSAVDAAAGTLQKAGVPVVFVNRKPAEEILQATSRSCYVGCDMAQAGQLQGQILQTLPDGGDLNGDGQVAYLIIQGPEDHLDAQACTEACAQALGETSKNLTVVSGDWTLESGKTLCAAELSRYGRDVEVIFCGNDVMTQGALAAVEEGGWIPGRDVYLIGMEGEQTVLDRVAQGMIAGTVCRDLRAQTDMVIDAANELLAGETPQKARYADFVQVTRENVQAFLE